MDLDIILAEIGNFGRFQTVTYLLLCFPVIFSAFAAVNYIFTAGDLNYRCLIPECENISTTVFLPQWLENAVPMISRDTPSNCKRYTNKTSSQYNKTEQCPAELFLKSEAIKCNRWVYETVETTIVREFDITCMENEWKRTWIGTSNNIATFLGLPVWSICSDKYGRKIVLIFNCVALTLLATISSFASSYYMYMLLEFMKSFFCEVFTASFVIAMEIVGPNDRVLGNTIINVAYAIGEAIVGLAMWWAQDWRLLLRMLYVPGFLFITYYWALPESIRWLMNKQQHAEATSILQLISKTNGKTMPNNTEILLKEISSNTNASRKPRAKQRDQLILIFQSRRLLLRVMNCMFCWVTNTFVYYGLSVNAVSLTGNKYLNFILVSLVEIPAYLVMWAIMQAVGRRLTLAFTLAICGTACFGYHFLQPDIYWTRLVFYLIGKLGITISFGVICLYTTEMFPTSVRQSMFGIFSAFSRIGSAMAPQTPLLAHYVDPTFIFGCVALLAGLLALLFPETSNIKLPDTVEQAEILGVK